MSARLLLQEIAAAAARGDAAAYRALLWSQPEVLRSYLHSFRLEGAPETLIAAYVDDALARFLRTLEFVPLPAKSRILEIGSNPYLFHILLRRIFPHAQVVGTNFFDKNIFSTAVGSLTQNIRSAEYGESYDFQSTLVNLETVAELPFAATSFDLVFFCETLEHLVVDPLSVFKKLHRVIAPGGHLIVTLPNAVRLTNIALLLQGSNFFDVFSANGVHGRHNREYTLEEVVHLLDTNQFRIARAETHDRFDYDIVDMWTFDYTQQSTKIGRRKKDILDALRTAGGSLENRGDNLYIVASPL